MFAKFAIATATAALIALAAGPSANAQSIPRPATPVKTAVSVPKPPIGIPGTAAQVHVSKPVPPSAPTKVPPAKVPARR